MLPTAVKDLEKKISEERVGLLRAGQHIANGQLRLRRQRDLLDDMRVRQLDTCNAERFAHTLQAMLEQWEAHRAMIGRRLAYLEGQRPPQG
jgi:ferredoxin-NADP reductase